MKAKTFIFCSLCVVLLICNACEEPMIQNKYNDNTKLWPAVDPTTAKVGYINEKGEMVIPPQFKRAFFFSNGKAKVLTEDDKTQFIDAKGNVVYTFPDSEVCESYFYNGYMKFNKNYPSGLGIPQKYGLYDSNFNVVLPDDFIELGTMSKEGLVATVAGYYNKKGELALTLYTDTFDINSKSHTTYSYGDFCDGVAVIGVIRLDNGRLTWTFGAIDTKGEWVIDVAPYIELRPVGGGLLAYRTATDYNRLGLMDTHGNKVTEPIFQGVQNFEDNDLLPVCVEYGKWGYVDKTGTMRIAPEFFWGEPFHEGIAWAWNEKEEYFLIDTNGNIVINLGPNVRPYTCYHNGLIGVLITDEANKTKIFKYIDKNNNTIYSWDKTNDDGSSFTPRMLLPSRVPKNEQQ